jgi:predicted AAA+ superfamily ATPase
VAYLLRLVDDELDALLPELAATALDGPKGVGKTATAERRCRRIFRLDVSRERAAVEADPELVLQGPGPTLVDEWQHVPEVWDVVRRQVDRDPTGGQFLLTGSATPRSGVTTHTGAGRIVRLRMRPMTLSERGVGTPTVSLRQLLSGRRAAIGGTTDVRLADYVEEIVSSGFPGIRALSGRARISQLDGYLRSAVDRDVPEQGLAVRKPEALLDWLRAYAAATATTASYAKIVQAASPGHGGQLAKTTVIGYRDVLTQLWLLDPVPAWTPGQRLMTRLQQAPRHHLADPALAARLLGLTADSLLRGAGSPIGPQQGTMLGHLFESLATLCLRATAQAAAARIGHLRTGNGEHEIDLVVIRDDGKILGIEIKLAGAVRDHDMRHLYWLRKRLGADLLDAVVITTGPIAYRRPDGIAVVPLALLGL